MFLRVIGLMFCLLMAGCNGGPDSQKLRDEVQAKLDTRFGEGLFLVQNLKRTGSYPFTEIGDPTERLLLYFDAQIRFLKDHSLSEWDQLDKSALASVLGAGPLGVSGVSKQGNQKDDILTVHGTSTYEKKQDKWVSSMHFAPQATNEPKPSRKFDEDGEVDSTHPSISLLNDISQRLTRLSRKEQPRVLAIEQDLEASLLSVQLKLDGLEGIETLLAGRRGGEYYSLASAMQGVYEETGETLHAYPTSGSEQNLDLLQAGMGTFALAQNDVAHREFADGRKNLRAVASLFPEVVHIVINRESKITRLSELKGRRISIGQKGSGMRSNAELILKAANLPLESFESVLDLSIREALDRLVRKELEAVFMTMAVPARSIEEASTKARLGLIPVPQEVQKNALKLEPWLVTSAVARNSYAGVDKVVPTLGVTAMALTRKETPAQIIQDFLHRMFDGEEDFSSQFGMAHYITTRTARVGIGMPMHEAAWEFFQERGAAPTP